MDSARIFIAMSNDVVIGKLKGIFAESGYIVVDQAKDGSECLRKVRTLKPDLTIVDYALAAMNGYEVSKVLLEDGLSDVILVVPGELEQEAGSLKQNTGFACLVKPINKAALTSAMEIMVKNRRKIRQLESELEQLKSSLDTRKEVEKAKGLLMKYLNLSEAEAFKRIQRQSMDRGIAMKEIAKAIILAYDI